MMTLILTILAVFAVLVLTELGSRRSQIQGEFSRKFVHISIGSFVAAWPFFLSWGQIKFLSLAFLLTVLISKRLNLFDAIHSVQRPTWGEVFFAIAVGLVAVIAPDKWIYTAALLQMSLADGLAAVVGTHYGGKYRYTVLGHTKSLAGTVTFYLVSLAILIALNPWLPHHLSTAGLVGTGIAATVIENIGIKGFDNLLVPLLVALVLHG